MRDGARDRDAPTPRGGGRGRRHVAGHAPERRLVVGRLPGLTTVGGVVGDRHACAPVVEIEPRHTEPPVVVDDQTEHLAHRRLNGRWCDAVVDVPDPDAGRVVEALLARSARGPEHLAGGVDAEQHRPDHLARRGSSAGRRRSRGTRPPRTPRPSAGAEGRSPCGRGSPGRGPARSTRASAASPARTLPRITFLWRRSSRASASCGPRASTTADPRRSWRCSCRSRSRRPRRPDP